MRPFASITAIPLAVVVVGALPAAVILGGIACQSVKPASMSVDEHEERAALEAQKAARAGARYDPDDTSVAVTEGPRGETYYREFNPSERFRAAEEHHQRLAVAHERAAAKLEVQKRVACHGVPEAERSACPDMPALAKVERIPTGVRAKLADPAQASDAVARVQCTQAYGDAEGDEAVARCPLYLRGMRVDEQGGWIVFHASHSEDQQRLLQALDEHLVK